MTTKNHISVLPLNYWMRYYVDTTSGRAENRCKAITPIFNRDGWYYNRLTKLEWYEYKGFAFIPENSKSGEMFKYRMKLLNARVLTTREVAAYKELLRVKPDKVVRDAIKTTLELDQEVKYLRNLRRGYDRGRKKHVYHMPSGN